MKRRSLIAVVAAGMLLILGLVVVAAVLVITRTRWGQNQVRTRLAESIAPAVRGRAPLIGHIDLSSILSSVSVDTIAVYDASGELVFSCGRIEASYDLRDLLDSRIALHHLTVQNPFLHFRQHANGEWNFNEVFRRSNAPSRAPQPKGFSWGDYVVLDSVSGQNATFVLSLPWQPDDTLHGASADSAIQRELRRTDHAIARTADGFARTYTWKNATAFLPHVRLADPDSDRRSGRVIEIGDLGVDESDPPFDFRNVSGLVRLLGDSLWASIAHFELPGSRGEAHGTVVWGGDAPPRLAIHVRADSLSLDDINWVYPGLPRTGGGTALLTIKNEKDPHILDFRLDSMDVRSTKSRLTGSMTFGTGAPVLLVRDVDVVADPIDFDFIRALNGKDFPIDWRGQLFGLVRGPGGPLTDFAIDSMTGEWRDGHVNGAVSRVSGKGGLNIVDPGTPVFHDFQLTVGTLDLRSIEYLFPSFPRLAGVISGVATLDSSLYDVRFHDADLTHTDGLGEPTRVTGSGRITTGAQVITYDVALDANPLSFDLLARSYPSLPLRGAMAGPIRAVGQLSDLDIKTQLSGRAGAFSFDGRVSADSTAPGGYGATGQGELVGLDLQQLVSRETSPATVTGHYDVNLRGLSAADVSGTAALDLDHSIVDHMELSTGHANVAFGGGVARLSQPAVFSGPDWSATAVGGIGLPGGGATDSLMVSIASESLGPWRPYVSSGILDSVSTGRDSANVNIVGRVDAFAVNGRAWTRGVVFGADSNPSLTAHYVEADFALDDVLTAPHGSVALAIDSLHLASYAIDTASASLQLLDSVRTTFTADWRHGAGLAAHLVGAVSRSGGVDTIRLDTGFVRTDSTTRWWLDAAPAHLVLTGGRLDSVNAAFATDSGARVSVVGSMRDSSSVVLDLATSGAPLRSFALLAEADVPVGGRADLVASIRGPRSSPRITYSASLVAPSYDDIHVDGFTARGTYHDGRSTDTLRVFQGATSAVSADLSIPIGLSLFGYRLMPDSAVSGHVQNGNVDLQFLQPFLPSTKDSGVVTVSGGALSLEGTWRRPRLVGDIALHDAKFRVAALGSVVFDSVNAGVHFFRDSVVIDSLHAHSGAGRGDHSAMLAGSMAMQPDRTGWSRILSPSAFNLAFGANEFAVFNNPTLARIDIQTAQDRSTSRLPRDAAMARFGGIQLQGPLDSARLTGNVIIQNSVMFLPDTKIASKTLGEESAPSDTAASAEPAWIVRLFNGLRLHGDSVTLGQNVSLKTLPDDPQQANVKLTGTLSVVPVPSQFGSAEGRAGGLSGRLAPQGVLQAVQGGQYTLDLGLVRRTFTVEPGSTISFDGTSIIPTLDIQMEYDSRLYGRPDITIVNTLKGPLVPGPKDSLSSPNAGYAASQSDLVSYLLIGGPGFDLGQNPSVAATLGAIFGPSLNPYFSGTLGRFLGPISFTGASSDVTQRYGTTDPFKDYIIGGRLSYESHVTSNVYVSLSSGLCTLGGTQQGQSAVDQFSQGLGAQLEYRFSTMSRLQAGTEPSTQAQLCSPSLSNLPGLAPTPRQYSFSFGYTWRW